jgi:hypothetical protein
VETILATAALALAVAALGVAWRARAIAVRARRRLREAEARGFEPEPAPFAPSPSRAEEALAEAADVADTLRRRIEALERRLEDAPAPAPAAAGVARSDEALVRQRLEADGWDPTSIAAQEGGAGSFSVEARRAGMVAKGTATVGPGRRVSLELTPALRAFP